MKAIHAAPGYIGAIFKRLAASKAGELGSALNAAGAMNWQPVFASGDR